MTEPGKGSQSGEGKVEVPKTLEDAIKLIETQGQSIKNLETALKDASTEAKERKEKLRAIEQEKLDAETEAKKKKGEYEELFKNIEPKAKRADELEKSLKEYYELEIADIPEEKRSLIPAGSVESQLSWVKKAKEQGVFGKPAEKPKDSKQTKPGDKDTPDFLTWTPDDKRLEGLSRADYERWKAHNGRGANGQPAGTIGWGTLPKT